MGAYGDIWTTIDGGVTYRFSDYLTKNNQSLYGYFLPNPFNDKELLVRTASRRCLSYTASGFCYYSVCYFFFIIFYFFINFYFFIFILFIIYYIILYYCY